MGAHHHIGFTVSSRFSWGMRGSYCESLTRAHVTISTGAIHANMLQSTVPVILRVFVSCIWFGIQAFWGGQATRVLIGAIIPGELPPQVSEDKDAC
jgi:NCS1 family nucleobase:cation symporter-1